MTAQVRVALTVRPGQAEAIRSSVVIFDYAAKCVTLRVRVPELHGGIPTGINGVPMTYTWQVYVSGRWATVDVNTWLTEAGGLSGVWFQYSPSWVHVQFRLHVRAAPSASLGLAPATSAWIRWRVERY